MPSSKKKVTPKIALTYSAVWRAVSLISETVGSLSFDVVRRLPEGGRELALNHPLYGLVHYKVSSWLSSQKFRETMQMIALLYGNAVAIIQRDANGFPESLQIVDPEGVKIYLVDNQKFFKIRGIDDAIADKDVIHIMGQSLNGYEGLSPIQYHAQSIGLGLSASEYQQKFYDNGASFKGVLQFQGSLKPGKPKEISEEWDSNYGGGNKFKTPVLHSGAEYKPMNLPQRDAQTIETMQYSIEDVARMYGVSLDKLANVAQTSYNSIEQNNMSFIQDCIRPKLKTWEAEYENKLFYGDPQYKLQLDLNSLLRGDIKTRIQFYRTMWHMGALNVNEIRAKENENPREGGDEYFNPMNMQSESMTQIMEKLAELELKDNE